MQRQRVNLPLMISGIFPKQAIVHCTILLGPNISQIWMIVDVTSLKPRQKKYHLTINGRSSRATLAAAWLHPEPPRSGFLQVLSGSFTPCSGPWRDSFPLGYIGSADSYLHRFEDTSIRPLPGITWDHGISCFYAPKDRLSTVTLNAGLSLAVPKRNMSAAWWVMPQGHWDLQSSHQIPLDRRVLQSARVLAWQEWVTS